MPNELLVHFLPSLVAPEQLAGQATVVIPAEIVMTLGVKDTLVIENQDNVVHSFGPYILSPESTFTHRFHTPLVYKAACTFHEDQVSLVVNPAPWSLAFWDRFD